MAVGNLDGADLLAAIEGGLINEDVMQLISDISDFPLVFSGMIGSDSHSNPYTEWTKDELNAQDLGNAVVDGSDQDNDDSSLGTREGNHSQTSVKQVKVSMRANDSDTIGRAREVSYQLSRRTRELRRDIEGIMLNDQASIADDGNVQAGNAASFGSWLVTNTFRGGGAGADGGFGATNPTDVDAPVAGDVRALTETLVRDAAQAAYESGGDPSIFMARPPVIRNFSEYLFDDTARIAVQQTQAGKVESPSKAVGSINVFTSDFGSVLELTPNRLQPGTPAVADSSSAYLVDPAGLRLSFLTGIHAEELGKTGLFENWLASADWTLKVLNEAQHAVIADIDETAAVTQS